MVWEFLKERMEMYPSSSIEDKERSYKFTDFLFQVERTSNIIKNFFSAHSKIAVLCKRQIVEAEYILACWEAECIPIPLSIQYGAEHCRKIISLTEPQVILCDDLSDPFFESLGFICHDINNLNKEKKREEENQLDDVAIIMCTSGTTGKPKGAMITHQNIIANLEGISRYFRIDSQDTILIARPLYHCAVLTGEFLYSLCKGVNVYFYDGQYNPLACMDIIYRKNISTLCATPTYFFQMGMLVKSPKMNLRNVVVSGERLTSNVGEEIRRFLPETNIYSVYGLTEASPRVAALSPNLFDSHLGSVGTPLYGINLKILTTVGDIAAEGENGRLWVKGANVMKGYYRDTIKTEKTICDGWLDTGDIARIINGFLYILSRADNMIIKAGMNIYPEEIEEYLKSSSSIKEVVAYKMRDSLTDKIGISIVPDEATENLVDYKKLCFSLLPRYLWPDVINIVDELPHNASGKLIRNI